MFSLYRFLKYLIPAVLLIIILYGYFWLRSFDSGKTDPTIAITENNLLFLETGNLISLIDTLLIDDGIWNDLKSIPEVYKVDSLIRNLKKLEIEDDKILKIIGGRVLFAINTDSANNLVPVLIVKQSQKIRGKQLLSILDGRNRVEASTKRKYKGSEIYDLKFKKSAGINDLSFTIKKGLIIISFSPDQVEKAIFLMVAGNGAEPIHNYKRLKLTVAGNNGANLFLNFSSIDKILNGFLNEPYSFFEKFATSAVYDFETGTDKIVLNGFSANNDSIADAIKIISGQTPSVMSLPDFIPASVTMVAQFLFNDPSAFFKNQAFSPVWKPDLQKIEEIDKAYSFNIKSYFEGMTGNEFGLVITDHNSKPAKFFISEVRSGSNIETYLIEGLKSWASSNKENFSDYHFYHKIDDQKGINIYRLPVGGIPEAIFGELFNCVSGEFFTVYENHLILGNSAAQIGEYAYQLILGRNVSSTDKFKKINDNLLSRSNIFIYLNPYKTAGMYSDKIKKEVLDFYNEHSENLEKFNTLTLQVNAADDLFYSRIYMNYSESINEYVNTVWMSKLESINTIKPAIVLNHTNGEKEIMVQDEKNQLYLISNAGRILWKAPLDGPLMSEIFQIDYYKNGKFQYLFNTKNKIFLIDRNGNAVEKYPVPLRSPATNGLSILDYEKDGNYRISIACENKKIYLYDLEGKIIPGWNPSATDHIVEKPVQHFRIEKRDFIVASDMYKTYIYDRRGRIRVNPGKQHPVSNNPFYLDISKGRANARLVCTDPLGNILYIYFTGTSKIVKNEAFNSQHFFVLSDLNNDNNYENIFTTGNKLVVTKEDGSLLFEKEFVGEINHEPVVYEFSKSDKKIGLVIGLEEKIYLFNNDGSLYTGFPLKGSTLFSINNFPGLNARFNLIVGNSDNFLYNYSVQ